MAANLKKLLPKLGHRKIKVGKKPIPRSRAQKAVFVCLSFIVLAALGFGLLVFADRNDNVQTKLASNPTASNTHATSASTPAPQSTSAATKPATTTPKSTASTSLTQGLIQANTQYTCTTFNTNMKYNYQTNVNELATNLGNYESTAYTDASQQGWSFTTLINTVNSDITNINGTIRQDWNTSFTGTPPSGCGTIPGVPSLLQVPSCDAADASGISSCIAQIDTSLDIDQ